MFWKKNVVKRLKRTIVKGRLTLTPPRTFVVRYVVITEWVMVALVNYDIMRTKSELNNEKENNNDNKS